MYKRYNYPARLSKPPLQPLAQTCFIPPLDPTLLFPPPLSPSHLSPMTTLLISPHALALWPTPPSARKWRTYVCLTVLNDSCLHHLARQFLWMCLTQYATPPPPSTIYIQCKSVQLGPLHGLVRALSLSDTGGGRDPPVYLQTGGWDL